MPDVVLRLLGIADKINPLGAGNPEVPVDIKGLQFVVPAWLYPFSLARKALVFLLERVSSEIGAIELRSERTGQVWRAEFDRSSIEVNFASRTAPHILGLPLYSELPPTLWEPGKLFVTHEQAGERTQLGNIEFTYIDPPPITPEQRLAIQSNPSLQRGIRFVIRCSVCRDGITPVAGLERVTLEPSEQVPRPTWYRDLEDRFTCACGGFSFPLRYLRDGLLSVLPMINSLLPDGSFASTGTVSVEEVEKTLALFRLLLDEDPLERDVQQFMEYHPLMLAPFAACWLKPKPPILNQRAADFGVINAAGDLLFIEIERPSIRLFTQEGVQGAELTHAFWQTQTWNQEIIRHRSAVLRCIDGCPSEVANIKYMVIAGRSELGNREAIDRIRTSNPGCDFMTYDQLIEAVRNTVRSAAG